MDLDIDSALKLIGGFGVRQRIYCALFFLKELFITGPILLLVFSAAKPVSFRCYAYNGSVYDNSCPANDVSNCETVHYVSDISSIVTEWNLICSNSYIIQMSQSVYMAGLLVGGIFLGYFSDTFGRARVYFSCVAATVTLSLISTLSPTSFIFICMRFLVGFATQGMMLASYVLLIELIGTSVRGTVSTWMSIAFTFGTVGITLIAYSAPDWRNLTFFTSIWGITFLPHFWILPESPRWLLLNGYVDEAKGVLMTIAKGNGTISKLPKEWSLVFGFKENFSRKADSIYMLFTHWLLLKYTLVLMYSWFVTGAVYYGLTLAAGTIGGSLYWNTVLLALVEIPGTFIQASLINRIGRRKLLCGLMICGGVSCFTIQFLPLRQEVSIVKKILALIGKLCSNAQFSVIFIHSAEIFPTSLRNGIMGILSVSSRVGGIITPFIVLFGEYITNVHFSIFGVMAFTAGICCMALPETNNKPLPSSIQNIISPNDYESEKTLLTNVDDSDDNEPIRR